MRCYSMSDRNRPNERKSQKLKNQEVSIDWVYRVIISSNRKQKSIKDDGNRRPETCKL